MTPEPESPVVAPYRGEPQARRLCRIPFQVFQTGLLGVYVLAGLMAAAALPGCKQPGPPPTPPKPFVEEAAPPKPAPVFTRSQFGKLLYDMTYKQVRDVLGADSTRQESTYDKGESGYTQPSLTAWHVWENKDGSTIKLGFINKKLVKMEASDDLPP